MSAAERGAERAAERFETRHPDDGRSVDEWVRDELTDLMHFCAREGLDWEHNIEVSEIVHLEELAELQESMPAEVPAWARRFFPDGSSMVRGDVQLPF
jgi:phytoene dehydrogenase-like protein